MMKLLQWLEFSVKVFPLIVQLVRSFEDAVPAGGQGVAKGDALKSLVAGIYEEVGEDLLPQSKVLALVEKIAATIVALFKKTGIFPPAV
jgi:hypothetical protein